MKARPNPTGGRTRRICAVLRTASTEAIRHSPPNETAWLHGPTHAPKWTARKLAAKSTKSHWIGGAPSQAVRKAAQMVTEIPRFARNLRHDLASRSEGSADGHISIADIEARSVSSQAVRKAAQMVTTLAERRPRARQHSQAVRKAAQMVTNDEVPMYAVGMILASRSEGSADGHLEWAGNGKFRSWPRKPFGRQRRWSRVMVGVRAPVRVARKPFGRQRRWSLRQRIHAALHHAPPSQAVRKAAQMVTALRPQSRRTSSSLASRSEGSADGHVTGGMSRGEARRQLASRSEGSADGHTTDRSAPGTSLATSQAVRKAAQMVTEGCSGPANDLPVARKPFGRQRRWSQFLWGPEVNVHQYLASRSEGSADGHPARSTCPHLPLPLASRSEGSAGGHFECALFELASRSEGSANGHFA